MSEREGERERERDPEVYGHSACYEGLVKLFRDVVVRKAVFERERKLVARKQGQLW